MAYSASAIANALLDIGRENCAQDLTPMKLQKLVYFAQGWHSAVANQDLINEPIEAWQYGPVVPSIYDKAKKYGNSPITGYLGSYVPTPQGQMVLVPDRLSNQELETIKPFLDWIWEQYGHYSGIALSNITHLPGTPWSETMQTMQQEFGAIRPHTDIPRESIKNYFHSQMENLVPNNA